MNTYPKEECGVVALYNIPSASFLAYLGIYALQHRGQEGTGIVSFDREKFYRSASMGKVIESFNKAKLNNLKGDIAIAHNRYSTTGHNFLRNIQPICMQSKLGYMSLAHNGNISNVYTIKNKLEQKGTIFQTTVDTEVIFHLMVHSPAKDELYALIDALRQVEGAFSLVILTQDNLYVVRDPHGFRPLVMGKKDNGWVFASETCALDIMDAEYIRDIVPGELLVVNANGLSSHFPFKKCVTSMCIFEFIYFSRPDSHIFEQPVYDVRFKLGEILAEESPTDSDIVISVPDSSNVAALGYSSKSKIPYHLGLIRSHYIGRTFIEPEQEIRDFGTKIKYNAISSVVANKRITVIDDSIVRGTTSKKITTMLRKAGAKEIHMRISSSPTKYACYYGIDIPTNKELVATTYNLKELAQYINVDTIAFLSIAGMKRAINSQHGLCTACFSGKYPVKIDSTSYETQLQQNNLFEEGF